MQIRSPPPLPRPTPHVGANPRPTASNSHAIYGGLGQQGYWNQSSFWSGRWESNPRPKLGKLLYCHCTTPALRLAQRLYTTKRPRVHTGRLVFSNSLRVVPLKFSSVISPVCCHRGLRPICSVTAEEYGWRILRLPR